MIKNFLKGGKSVISDKEKKVNDIIDMMKRIEMLKQQKKEREINLALPTKVNT